MRPRHDKGLVQFHDALLQGQFRFGRRDDDRLAINDGRLVVESALASLIGLYRLRHAAVALPVVAADWLELGAQIALP